MSNYGESGIRLRRLVAVVGVAVVFISGCSRADRSDTTVDPPSSSTMAAVDTVPVDASPTVTSDGTTPAGTTPESNAANCEYVGTIADSDVQYARIDGVRPNLLSLDVYEPERVGDCADSPIMIYVHGGAWSIGNKNHAVEDKISWFNERGWVFVSVNYRLSPVSLGLGFVDLDPDRIKFPIHNEDVASAVAWVHDHAGDYTADPDVMSIMGHSAGAGITAAIATDERYLSDHGLGLGNLRCAVPLDTAAFDVRERIEESFTAGLYQNAFGDEPAIWDEASPINHVAPDQSIPDFFVVARGSASRIAQGENFAEALRGAGVLVVVVRADELSHEGVNDAVGRADDDLITPALEESDHAVVARVVPGWRYLSPSEQDILLHHTDRLLGTFRWEAAKGFELTDAMCVHVAAQAALPVMSIGRDFYRRVGTVIVRPKSVRRTRVSDGPVPGVVEESSMVLAGEAADGDGPVVLAWDSVVSDTRHPARALNVVIHEFAHKIDLVDHIFDGTPAFADEEARLRWIEVCNEAFDRLRSASGPSGLNSYAATNPAEFFAVATETFFTTPVELSETEPDLYRELHGFFRQDPAGRQLH